MKFLIYSIVSMLVLSLSYRISLRKAIVFSVAIGAFILFRDIKASAYESIIFALFIAIPLGIISALKSETWIDSLCTILAVSGVAMPQYLLGMVFILLFSLRLDWLPSSGFIPATENLWLNIRGMIMPGIVLGAVVAGEVMRQLRSSMLEVLHEEYIQTARSKGLSEYTVIIKHALRNALIPVVTLLGLRIGRFVGGLVIIEVVFSMPGIYRTLDIFIHQ